MGTSEGKCYFYSPTSCRAEAILPLPLLIFKSQTSRGLIWGAQIVCTVCWGWLRRAVADFKNIKCKGGGGGGSWDDINHIPGQWWKDGACFWNDSRPICQHPGGWLSDIGHVSQVCCLRMKASPTSCVHWVMSFPLPQNIFLGCGAAVPLDPSRE